MCKLIISRYDEVMIRCWDKEPEKRPTFSDVVDYLTSMMTAGADYLLISNL